MFFSLSADVRKDQPDRPLLAQLIISKGSKSERGYYTLDPAVVGPFADNNVGNAAISGRSANVTVTCGDRIFHLAQLQKGMFPTVYCAPNQEAKVSIHFPMYEPGETVYLSAASGGELSSTKVQVDEKNSIHFDLKLNEYEGTYPIETYKDGERKALSFWVGPITVHESRLKSNDELPKGFKKLVPVRKPLEPVQP